MRTMSFAKVVGLALLLALPAAACDFISPTTSDPNGIPVATLDQLFTGIEVNTYMYAEGQLSRLGSMWIQQMTGTDRQFKQLDSYILTEEDANGEFATIYTGGGLIDLKTAIADATAANRRAYAGILKIHEAYQIGMAASIWGDIPFSQAADPTVDDPKLDKQADVYAAMQKLLDDAIADLNAGTGAPGAVDLNFSGNTARWIAVAHTLKARYYMHWAEVNGASAYTSALAEAAQGITSNAGNWRGIHTTTASENAIWFQFMRDRSGYIGGGDYLVPSMVARNDPRLPFYFSQAATGGFAARSSLLSQNPGGYGAEDFNFPIVTCAEAAYIRAEAQYQLNNQAAARTAAKDGLACEEARFNVDLSSQKALLDAAAGAALLQEIMLEKYTAQFLNMDAWNDWKRTCLPQITQRAGGVPGRLYYGADERISNSNIPDTDKQPKRNANDPNACT